MVYTVKPCEILINHFIFTSSEIVTFGMNDELYQTILFSHKIIYVYEMIACAITNRMCTATKLHMGSSCHCSTEKNSVTNCSFSRNNHMIVFQ